MEIKKINKTLMVGALASAMLLQGCDRPTKYDSTFETDMNNKFTWNEMGPAIEFAEFVGSQTLVSHKRKTMNFPVQSDLTQLLMDDFDVSKFTSEQNKFIENGEDDAFITSFKNADTKKKIRLLLETDQSIITASNNFNKRVKGDVVGAKEIMIQQMIVGYRLKPDEESVRKMYIEHRTENHHLLEKNLDGLLRTFLQSKTRDYIETHQSELGDQALEYITSFKVGGTPVFNDSGKVTGFANEYTIEEEWGIEVMDVSSQRVKAPSYVLSAIPEGQGLIKKAQAAYESSEAEATQRRARLQTLLKISEQVGSNPAAARYLTSQTISDLVEDLGHKNIGKLSIVQGLKGDSQKIQYSAANK